MSSFIILTLVLGQVALGFMILHKAVPAALAHSRWKAVETLLLALVLLLFAAARSGPALAGTAHLNHWLIGHIALLAYSVMRYRRLLRPGRVLWWEADGAEEVKR